ncbi:DUF2190 family protein [Mesorhizobium sp. GbtcB19]|uniref:DUF2190 family protein n=1 Tax=Mesorhizobium sp. GbtcB19 TaxID=2824764 RepID=UPI001C30D3A3|nr:DUF2190 family protein [Mesorhizobium sp. GbtcB19]
MKNYIQPGNIIPWTNSDVTGAADVASGDGVVAGSLFGVAQGDIAVGDSGELAVTGVFELPKTTSQAWTFGQRLYWDAAGGKLTSTASSNKLVGVAIEATASDAAVGKARLSGAFTL